MKLSKRAKARIKMMTIAEKKTVTKAARTLAECEAISMKRADVIIRWCNKGGY
jgi:hypothetical protein